MGVNELRRVLEDRDRSFDDGKFHLCEKLYVPTELVTQEHLDVFTYIVPVEIELVDGTTEMVKQPLNLWVDHGNYHSFHRGDLVKLETLWPEINEPGRLVDHRCTTPLGIDLEFIEGFEYREYETGKQYDALLQILDPNLGGIIKAFPAFGKTVIMVALAIANKMSLLVIAHKKDLLKQFEKTVINLTNIRDLEEFDNKKYVYRLNKKRKCPPIATTTFHYLLANPEFAEKVSEHYGMVLVDEAHHIGAEGFTTIFSCLNPFLRYGATATPYRTDSMDVIFPDILGPVRVDIPRPSSNATAYIFDTGVAVPTKYDYCKWPMPLAHSFLAKVESRNKQIAENALDDALCGYTVLVLTYRINQIDAIYTILKELLKDRDDIYIEQVEKLYAKTSEDEEENIKERLESGESKFLITTSQKFGEGSDVPCLSALHYTFPLSNKKTVEQIYTRITRQHPTKKDPKITYYRDHGMNRILGIAAGWKNRMIEFGVKVIDPKDENVTSGSKLTLWDGGK